MTCMTSVGFGNVAPETDNEKIFTICMMVIGGMYYNSNGKIFYSYMFILKLDFFLIFHHFSFFYHLDSKHTYLGIYTIVFHYFFSYIHQIKYFHIALKSNQYFNFVWLSIQICIQ